MKEKAKTDLQSTFKSQDTEEWLDIYFTRPLGLLWARFFNLFGTHPNVITILSIFLGVAAGVCFYFDDLLINIVGILLLIWANLYDSADGQLARMTGKKSRIGRALDGFAGDAWFVSIYFFMCLRLTPTWGIWIWLLCALAGLICHSKQCQLADYYRNIHLFFLKGESGSELDNSKALEEEYSNLKWSDNPLWKTYLYFYGNYTRSQEAMTPAFQKFKQVLAQRFPKELPQTLRDDFRKGSLPLMKYANILTFNVRAITLYIAILVREPWIYPVFEITVMSALCIYMRNRHEKLCKHLKDNIDKYESKV